MADKKVKKVKEYAVGDFSTEEARQAHIDRKLAKRAAKKKARAEKTGRYADPVKEKPEGSGKPPAEMEEKVKEKVE